MYCLGSVYRFTHLDSECMYDLSHNASVHSKSSHKGLDKRHMFLFFLAQQSCGCMVN